MTLSDKRRSGSLDFVEQIGVAIKQLEQLDQSQGRLGLAVLVTRKGIYFVVVDWLKRAQLGQQFSILVQ